VRLQAADAALRGVLPLLCPAAVVRVSVAAEPKKYALLWESSADRERRGVVGTVCPLPGWQLAKPDVHLRAGVAVCRQSAVELTDWEADVL
jgi:hypothetical protein